ncbi:MAG: MFS transporter [Alphaproteobacteria bacterium]|jgi:predicted MFS family arabinose efflux permease|nr:MFS transporter [Alphaproteobacteria bacterium]
MISWAVFAPPVLAKQALPDMGLDPAWIGMLPVILFTAATFSSMMSAGLVSRFNPMRASQVMVLLCAIGSGLIATGNLWLVGVGSALIGIGLGPATPASSHILSRVTPRHLQPLVFSIKQTGVPFGGVLAGFVGPPLTLIWNWQIAILVVAAACLAIAIITEIWSRNYARFSDPSIKVRLELIAPLRLLLRSPVIRWMLGGCVPLVIAQYALTTFIVLYLQEDIGLSVITAGAVLAVAQASGGTGRIIFGAIASRWASPLFTLLMLAVLASAAAFLTASLTASWPLALIYGVGVLFGAGAAGWNGVYLAEAARRAPGGEVSRTTGAIGFVIFAAVVIGPAVFGAIVATVSYEIAYAGIGILMLVSVCSFLRAMKLIRAESA